MLLFVGDEVGDAAQQVSICIRQREMMVMLRDPT